MKWLAILLLAVIAVASVAKGIRGIQTKRITGRWDVEYRGTTAQVIGSLFVLGGVLAALMLLGLVLGLFPI